MRTILFTFLFFVFFSSQALAQYTNPNTITVADGGVADWYPSIITVPNAGPYLKVIEVFVPSIWTTGDLSGLDMVLQSPAGTKVILHSDVRTDTGFQSYSNIHYAWDGLYTPAQIYGNGTYYHPFNFGSPADTFPAPGPGIISQPQPSLAAMVNENPNGTWRLWIVDDSLDGVWEQVGGWQLNIQTSTTPVCPHADLPEVSAVTDSSAQLTWLSIGPADRWDVFVTRTDTFQFPGNPTHPNLATNNLLLNNLTAGKGYGVWVRSKCANGTNSECVGPIYFDTEFFPCKYTTPIDACQIVHCDSVPEYTVASIESSCGQGTPNWLFRFTPPETGPYYIRLNSFGSRVYWQPDTSANCPTNGWNCLVQNFPPLDTIFVDTLTAGISYFFFLENSQEAPVFSLSNCPLPYMGFGAGLIFTDSVVLSFGNVPALPLTDSLEVYFGPVPLAPPDAGTVPTSGIHIDRETGVATIGGLLPASTYAVYLRKRCDATRTSCWQGPAEMTTLQVCGKVDLLQVDTVTYSWANISFSGTPIHPDAIGWELRFFLPGQDPDLVSSLSEAYLYPVGQDTIRERLQNIPSYQPLHMYVKANCSGQDPYYQPWQGPFDMPAGQTPPVEVHDIFCGEENTTIPEPQQYTLDGVHINFLNTIVIQNPGYQFYESGAEKIFRYTANQDDTVRITWTGSGYTGFNTMGVGFFVKPDSTLPGNQDWNYLGIWKFGTFDPASYPTFSFEAKKDSSYYILCDAFGGSQTEGGAPFFIGDCDVTCPKVDSITLVSATSASVTLRWNNSAQGGKYKLSYRPTSGTIGGDTLTTSDTVVTLNGLLPSAEYYFQIRAFCSPSDASGLQTATYQLADHLVTRESAFGRCNPRFVPPGKTMVENYEVFEVNAPQNGDYLLNTAFYDSYLYADAFDPAKPSDNLIAAVTDYGPDGRKDTTLALETAKTYLWVTTLASQYFNHESNKNLRLQADGPGELDIGPAKWNGREPEAHGAIPVVSTWLSGVCPDTAGWMHFYATSADPADLTGDKLLLSLKGFSNVAGLANLPLFVGAYGGASKITNPPALFVQNPSGWYEMNRFWLMQDLMPVNQVDSVLTIRSYYTEADFNDVKTAIEAAGGVLPAHEDMYFHKINGYHSYSLIDPTNGHPGIPAATTWDGTGYWEYANGAEATTSTWRHGTLPGGGHYAEMVVRGFSGGGGGASVNGNGPLNPTVGTISPTEYGDLSIWPNPNAGVFTVGFPEPAAAALEIHIADVTGRVVATLVVASGTDRQTVDASHLPGGFYTLQATTATGTRVVGKFFKE
ncbi:MAG: T9SS type A sorting domain-containing protein [Saprospiraceae bacterium]